MTEADLGGNDILKSGKKNTFGPGWTYYIEE